MRRARSRAARPGADWLRRAIDVTAGRAGRGGRESPPKPRTPPAPLGLYNSAAPMAAGPQPGSAEQPGPGIPAGECPAPGGHRLGGSSLGQSAALWGGWRGAAVPPRARPGAVLPARGEAETQGKKGCHGGDRRVSAPAGGADRGGRVTPFTCCLGSPHFGPELLGGGCSPLPVLLPWIYPSKSCSAQPPAAKAGRSRGGVCVCACVPFIHLFILN